jgi:Fic family protein
MFYDQANLIVTVKEIENRFVVSNQTARSDLLLLVDKGFLEIIQANKKKQIFVRTENFEKLL